MVIDGWLIWSPANFFFECDFHFPNRSWLWSKQTSASRWLINNLNWEGILKRIVSEGWIITYSSLIFREHWSHQIQTKSTSVFTGKRRQEWNQSVSLQKRTFTWTTCLMLTCSLLPVSQLLFPLEPSPPTFCLVFVKHLRMPATLSYSTL